MQKDLFLTKDISVVREGKTLKFEKEKHLRRIPVNFIRAVFVFGNVNLSYGARNLLLEKNKNIYFFNHKGEFIGALSNEKLRSNYKLRLLQFKYIDNLDIAKYFILKKIEYIEKWIGRSLQRYKEQLNVSNTLNEILGVEGKASTYMFDHVRDLLNKKGIEFKKREYRPVKDRINSLLSFAYTLFYGFLHPVIYDRGFDPYIGFLHKKRGKHMSFVSDIIEIYRPIITSFIVQLLLNDKISKEDFNEIYLNYDGRKKFLKYYIDFLELLDLSEVDNFIRYLHDFEK